MAEDTTESQQGAQQQIGIQRIYIKDLSFESPNAPDVFKSQHWAPQMKVNLASSARSLGNDHHEVLLRVTVTASHGDATTYLVEVQQAGIFQAAGFDDETLDGILGAYCPHILFPYARETVADMITKGGFPPFHLAPVNFDALYMQKKAQQGTKETPGGEPATH
jgi:preprotein translocase subunit SecB